MDNQTEQQIKDTGKAALACRPVRFNTPKPDAIVIRQEGGRGLC